MREIVKVNKALVFEINDFSVELLLYIIIDEFDLKTILRIVFKVFYIILLILALIGWVNAFVDRFLPSAQKRLSHTIIYLN